MHCSGAIAGTHLEAVLGAQQDEDEHGEGALRAQRGMRGVTNAGGGGGGGRRRRRPVRRAQIGGAGAPNPSSGRPLTMKIDTYLYSVNRKELAPSLIAACRSAHFSSICGAQEAAISGAQCPWTCGAPPHCRVRAPQAITCRRGSPRIRPAAPPPAGTPGHSRCERQLHPGL